eukprot:scaffold25304_cov45-Phaeocystis_antarctica.AAC.1
MARHGKAEQRQDYPFSRVAPGSTLFAGLAQLPTRVQKVAAWRVGWRRSQGRDSRRARTVTSILRRSKKHSLGFFGDSPIRGTMVYPH